MKTVKSVLHVLLFFSLACLAFGQGTPPRPTSTTPKQAASKPREVDVKDLPQATRYDYVRSPRDPFLDKSVTETIMGSYKPNVINKLILLSWLDEGGQTAIYVQNTDTNEVQRITSTPNKDNLRIVEIRPNADPKLFEVVISDGNAQGSVKFRLTPPKANPQNTGTATPAPQTKAPQVESTPSPRPPPK
jgi:hypothetical protein